MDPEDEMHGFTLTKWYMDCVDPDGRSAIVYWMAVSWGGVRVVCHSVSMDGPGLEPWHRSSLARVPPPRRAGAAIEWTADAIGCAVSCQARGTPFSARLLEGQDGTLDWHCEAAAAEMSVAVAGGPTVRGAGYAERLVLNIIPWRLPIEELRWGRWVSRDAGRSVVWIDWRGAAPMTAVFLDGVRQAGAVVGDDRIVAGDAAVTLSDRRTLSSRSVAQILGGAGMLVPLLPDSWLALQDVKWLSRGILTNRAAPDEDGWAIHERVRFPGRSVS